MRQTSIVLFFIALLLTRTAASQTTSCSLSNNASSYSVSCEICEPAGSYIVQVQNPTTLFHGELFSGPIVSSSPSCFVPTTPISGTYAAGVFGREDVTIKVITNPGGDVVATDLGQHVRARAAAVELVLDKSGSMNRPGKFAALQLAARQFIDTVTATTTILRGATPLNQHYGVNFYNQTATFLNAAPVGNVDYEVPDSADGGLNENVRNAIDTTTAGGGTSIGGGLQLARTTLQANILTAPVNDSVLERPVILMLTDGYETTSPMVADEQPLLIGQGIPVYTIGFGTGAEINQPLLQSLSTATSGIYRQIIDPLALPQYFNKVIEDNYAQTQMIMDPEGNLTPGHKDKIKIPVSEYEKAVIVVLTWLDKSANLGLQVKGPGIKVDEDDYPSSTKIFDGGNYRIFAIPVCQKKEKRNGKCGKPGNWQATVRGDKSLEQNYSLHVLSRSDAHMLVSLPSHPYNTGDKLPVSLDMFVGGKRKGYLKASAIVSVPHENMFDKIAKATKVKNKTSLNADSRGNQVVVRGKAIYGDQDIKRKTIKLPIKARKLKKKDKHATRYLAKINTRFPGSYNMVIRGEWKTPQGHILMRETSRSVFVPAAASSNSRIRTRLLSRDRKSGIKRVRIRFTPKDRYGDLIGIGRSQDIKLCSSRCSLGKFKDLGNGSYSIDINVPSDWESLKLSMMDKSWPVSLSRWGKKKK